MLGPFHKLIISQRFTQVRMLRCELNFEAPHPFLLTAKIFKWLTGYFLKFYIFGLRSNVSHKDQFLLAKIIGIFREGFRQILGILI